jgi:hypothetical protein
MNWKIGSLSGNSIQAREFFNTKVIKKMNEHKLKFVFAAKSNKIKEIHEKN